MCAKPSLANARDIPNAEIAKHAVSAIMKKIDIPNHNGKLPGSTIYSQCFVNNKSGLLVLIEI